MGKSYNRGKHNPMYGVHRFGKNAPYYKDGRCNKKYYCKCDRQMNTTVFFTWE